MGKAGRHALRIALRERDGSNCCMCGNPINFSAHVARDPDAASIEHVVPLAWGGTWDLKNLRLAHKRCNNEASSFPSLPNRLSPA